MSIYGYAIGFAFVSAAGLATLITSFVTSISSAQLIVSCVVFGCIAGASIIYFGRNRGIVNSRD